MHILHKSGAMGMKKAGVLRGPDPLLLPIVLPIALLPFLGFAWNPIGEGGGASEGSLRMCQNNIGAHAPTSYTL